MRLDIYKVGNFILREYYSRNTEEYPYEVIKVIGLEEDRWIGFSLKYNQIYRYLTYYEDDSKLEYMWEYKLISRDDAMVELL